MKFTVLIENTGSLPMQCEHGLSILIEYKGKQYLLDAGTTDLFLENAEVLQAPIWKVKDCFLSHGHYDHSGGFATYLNKNKEAVLYMMKNATGDFYSKSGEVHPIGIPGVVLELHESRFHYIHKVTKWGEGIYLVPHNTAELSKIGERAKLYRKEDDNLIPDDFSHEMSLVFDIPKGLVIFNSCSHGGPMNIIREVMEAIPGKNVYAFVGGLHMKGGIYSEEEIFHMAEELRRLGLEVLYTGHCTGPEAMETLRKYMGEQIKELYTGLTVEL